MSIRTTADERLDTAREHIQSAIVALADVTINEVWGSDSYNDEYKESIETVFNDLRKARQLLKI